MKHIIKFVSLGLAAAVLSTGCAGKTEVKPEQPVAAATPTPTTAQSYVVQKGDSLWAISAKSSVLGDPFRWPLIFKANRDQIEDPDLIQVSQDLSYSTNYSTDEIDSAVSKAKETPPFVPHASPRKSLPVQY